MEAAAHEYIRKIDAMGGIVRAIDTGYPQREIADAAYRYQLMEDRNEKVVVGVNKYAMTEGRPIQLPQDRRRRRARGRWTRVRRFKASRDAAKVGAAASSSWPRRAAGRATLMPVLIDAVKDYVSLGEIADVYRQAFASIASRSSFRAGAATQMLRRVKER